MQLVPVCHTDVSGGAERYLNLLYARLEALGHSANLVGSVPGWHETGMPYTRMDFSPKWGGKAMVSSLPRLPDERAQVRRLVRAMPADLFHVQFKREQIGLTDLLARQAPVVWTEHGTLPAGSKGRALAAGYRLAARKVAAIICVSEEVGANVQEVVGRRVRVEVVPNAIDTTSVRVTTSEQRARARAQLRLPSGDVRVLAWVGRLSPGKLPLLAAEVGRHFPGITVLAGEGALEPELRQVADGLRVRHIGFRADPGVLYQAADAFLFTSDGSGEGLPTTLLEAAAHGLPIVVNAGSGAGQTLGDAGRVASDDARALAAAAAATHRPSAPARSWALSHDVAPWAGRHAEVMASVAGNQAA